MLNFLMMMYRCLLICRCSCQHWLITYQWLVTSSSSSMFTLHSMLTSLSAGCWTMYLCKYVTCSVFVSTRFIALLFTLLLVVTVYKIMYALPVHFTYLIDSRSLTDVGTPHANIWGVEMLPANATAWVLSVRNELSHCTAWPRTPNDSSKWRRRILWSTMSKAALISSRPGNVIFWLSAASVMSEITFSTLADIAARSSLRSAERGDLFVPRTRTTKLSQRSFTVAAPVVWNSLPAYLRSPLSGWA